MANILAILPGVTLADLTAMMPLDLMRWHERAAARAPGKES